MLEIVGKIKTVDSIPGKHNRYIKLWPFVYTKVDQVDHKSWLGPTDKIGTFLMSKSSHFPMQVECGLASAKTKLFWTDSSISSFKFSVGNYTTGNSKKIDLQKYI